jgi:hypothetical protein
MISTEVRLNLERYGYELSLTHIHKGLSLWEIIKSPYGESGFKSSDELNDILKIRRRSERIENILGHGN